MGHWIGCHVQKLGSEYRAERRETVAMKLTTVELYQKKNKLMHTLTLNATHATARYQMPLSESSCDPKDSRSRRSYLHASLQYCTFPG